MPLKIKLKRFTASSGDPSTSDLEVGEVGINPVQKKIFVNNSGTIVALGSADFSAVDQDIIPDGDGTRNLGSASKRFAELFLTGQTINLGGATIDSDGTGTVSVSATGVTLPAGAKAGDNKLAVTVTGSGGTEQAAQVIDFFSKAGGNKLAVTVTGSGGAEQAAQVVDFFSAAGGLSSANTQFSFNATVDDKFVFTVAKTFTLANGSSLADSNVTLFQF